MAKLTTPPTTANIKLLNAQIEVLRDKRDHLHERANELDAMIEAMESARDAAKEVVSSRRKSPRR